MNSILARTLTLLLALLLAITSMVSAQKLDEQACQDLADLYINDTNLLSAVVVPSEGELPEYCRVLGYVRPAINFEIRLPTSSWNGKFYMGGCGGTCGRVNPNEFLGGLRRNYAVSTTDTGHWGANFMDDQWAYHNLPAKRDWAHRGVHETARVTKTVIEAYYGQPPAQSYFQGCSNGGRQANMEAWRYPEDFDGIISGAPDLDYTGFGIFLNWVAKANTSADNLDIITAADAQIVGEAVYAECDEQDGLKDGLIEDPRNCTFDVERLVCSGPSGKNCWFFDK